MSQVARCEVDRLGNRQSIKPFVALNRVVEDIDRVESRVVHHLAALSPFNTLILAQRVGAIDIAANLDPVRRSKASVSTGRGLLGCCRATSEASWSAGLDTIYAVPCPTRGTACSTAGCARCRPADGFHGAASVGSLRLG